MEFYSKKINNKQFILGTIILVLIIIISYKDCFSNFFIGDDFPWITHSIKMKINFFNALIERYTWFTSSISFYLNLLIFGTNPIGYYLTNIFIHLVNVILLGILVFYLSNNKFLSLLVMLLWGVNAQGIESILWLTGRGHSLLLLFILATLVSFIKWRKTKKIFFYVLSILCTVCAHLTLFNAIIIPLLMIIYILLFENFSLVRKKISSNLKIISPYFIVTFMYIVFYLFVKTTLPVSSYYKFDLSIFIKFGKYLFDYFDFLYLNYKYLDYNNINIIVIVSVVFSFTFLISLILIKDKIIKFGLLWILITMLGYLPVPTVKYFQYSRYRYIPIVGFCIILSVVISKNIYLKTIITILITVFIILFLVVNIYYIYLEELGYNLYGEYHKLLVNNANFAIRDLPKEQIVIFINNYKFSAPQYIHNYLKMPRPLFVRVYAPLGLIYINDLLNFCSYGKSSLGTFITEPSKSVILNKLTLGEYTGLQFTEKGFSLFKFEPKYLNILIDKWEKLPELPPNVTALIWKENF